MRASTAQYQQPFCDSVGPTGVPLPGHLPDVSTQCVDGLHEPLHTAEAQLAAQHSANPASHVRV